MSFLRNILLLAFFVFLIYYIIDTREYYKYCKYANMKNDYIIEKDKKFLELLCKSTFKDFSQHSIMNFSINLIYSFIDTTNLDESYRDRIGSLLNNTDKMQRELYFLKIVHVAYCTFLLYYIVLKVPSILISIMQFLIEKFLFIIFCLLVIEIIINVFVDLNFDSIGWLRWLYSLFPFHKILSYLQIF